MVKKNNKNVPHRTKVNQSKDVVKSEKFTNVNKQGKGRPQKSIDYIMVKELASQGCTIEEIARYLNVSHDTLTRREEFMPIYLDGLNLMKRSLRRKQYDLAMEGDRTMLVWLGKQHLDQTDRRETEMTVQGGEKPIKIMPVQERIKEYEHLFQECT
jgi:transcriptional antiterminator